MSEYKGIQGFTVQSLASDPSPLLDGQMWYNSTSKTLKVSTSIGTWATGNNMNTARTALAGAGTQTAALGFGGALPAVSAVTEKYDGTNWTTVNSMNTARQSLGGVGTQTAALAFGGGTPAITAATEEWTVPATTAYTVTAT